MLCALARRPHEVLGMRLPLAEALSFDVTVLRAAMRHRITETGADMQQAEHGDEMGIGRILSLLFRQTVRGA